MQFMTVDKQGIVRYIQVIPELTHLPDMDGALAMATEFSKES
jgi:thioredoxin-dependent peroxiredoxin